MNFTIQAETPHNSAAYTDEAFYQGDWINGVVVQLGVDGQDADGVTSIMVELEGNPNEVLCQQMDVYELRPITGHIGGQSASATSNLLVWLDFGFKRLNGRRLKVTVTGTSVASATTAIDVVKDNYDPTLPCITYGYHSAQNFSVSNCLRLYGFESGMATDDASVNVGVGGNTYALSQQSAWRAYSYKGLEDSPATYMGLFYDCNMDGGKPQAVAINHAISGLVFISICISGPYKNLGRSSRQMVGVG